MARKTVLVAGASGLVGHAAIEHFLARPDWDVIGVSRRLPADLPGAALVSLDLSDAEACERAAGSFGDVTHVVYAALFELPGLFRGWLEDEQIQRNGAMCRNLFEPLLEGGCRSGARFPAARHQGVRHSPPVDRPCGREEPAARARAAAEHPNFYFVQEDYLREKQRAASWGLTVFRPTVIYGDAVGQQHEPHAGHRRVRRPPASSRRAAALPRARRRYRSCARRSMPTSWRARWAGRPTRRQRRRDVQPHERRRLHSGRTFGRPSPTTWAWRWANRARFAGGGTPEAARRVGGTGRVLRTHGASRLARLRRGELAGLHRHAAGAVPRRAPSRRS